MLFDGLGSEVRNTTLAAVGLSALGLAAYAIWFGAGWPLLTAYAVVAALATLSVPLLYRLGGHTLTDELEWLERREAGEHDEMTSRLRSLVDELDALGIEEGEQQARTLTELLEDYHAVVETRFLGSRSGPIEYLTTARRVQKQAVQNLTDMVATGHSLASLARDDGAVSGGEGDRLARRAAQVDAQRERLDALIDENRQLFDALRDTAVEVANIPSFSRYERLDTLARLTSLAEIANRRVS